ncbi:fructosamine-3-kinase [Kribbella antiqua]|uniref:Fructosamine-3-kinase n=1 Tax=Kribbella antiqua TaxID=2512217 RepID=A0A4V6NNL9_9ACTN|nr:fructosamine kinase family protein [Kribbella antiqua]TCO48420.1 fructosamine-3-kinase [Kribbella antiqua]
MLTPSWLDGLNLGDLNLGDAVASDELPGGVANKTYRVRTTLGRSVIVKTHDNPPVDLYAREADGLNALRIPGAFVVPEVLRATDDFLVLADLAEPPSYDASIANRPAEFWRDAGHRLAIQHQQVSDKFGYHHDNYLGLLRQRNPWTDDGHAFFAEYRLLRFLEVPLCYHALPAEDRRRLERVASRLPDLIPPQSPALVHGDLWHGNLLAAKGTTPAAIDPAVYYGWPEAELSMLDGCGNIPDTFFTAYEELHPLEAGWQARLRILHLREHLAVLAHFGEVPETLTKLHATLDTFS